MPIGSTSFLIATNPTLTIEFNGFEDLVHQTDESDNPQDLPVLYLGSLHQTAGVYDTKLQTTVSPGSANITLTPTDSLPKWQANTVTTLHQMMQPTAPNGFRYEVTTAGTTAATEPTWPLTIGSTVVNGTAILTNVSPKHEVTEVTLALSPSELNTNIPGGALSLGNTILGGPANRVPIYIRVVNNVNIVSSNVTYPEITIVINSVSERFA